MSYRVDTAKHIIEAHGNGGKLTHELISSVFAKILHNPVLDEGLDSGRFDHRALFAAACERHGVKADPARATMAVTTDSYVVKPLFFSGGDIGKIAVCGTVNDLAVSGALPLAITLGFIIEEGFMISDLEKISESIAKYAQEAGVVVATGDTKVVGRGQCDGLFVNSSGVGMIPEGVDLSPKKIAPGDAVVVTGTVGNHGACILNERGGFVPKEAVVSDCAPLAGALSRLLAPEFGVRVMRDPTRGGVATTLNEFVAQNGSVGIVVDEKAVPYDPSARALSEILGIDLMYSANEGRALIVCEASKAPKVLDALAGFPATSGARVIGSASDRNRGRVVVKSAIGGGRFMDMQVLEQFPRIC